jgi:hypothetical protein
VIGFVVSGQSTTDLGWQPIETAPKDGSRILCWVPLSDSVDILWWHGDHWEDDVLNIAEPTHWMGLPPRPCAVQPDPEQAKF